MCMCMCMRVQGGQDFLDQEGDLCGTWAENFFLAQVFTGLAAGCVAIVNVLLKIILTRTCGVWPTWCVARHPGLPLGTCRLGAV